VGATDGGLPFLEEEDIIPAILDIVTRSPIPSVRGYVSHHSFVTSVGLTTVQGHAFLFLASFQLRLRELTFWMITTGRLPCPR